MVILEVYIRVLAAERVVSCVVVLVLLLIWMLTFAGVKLVDTVDRVVSTVYRISASMLTSSPLLNKRLFVYFFGCRVTQAVTH